MQRRFGSGRFHYDGLMVLRGFEQRLEKMVEGTFARMFKSGLTPIEVGQRIARSMDAERSAGVRGRTVVPNNFVIAVSEDDWETFSQIETTLTSELVDAAREHAVDEQYSFLGFVEVTFVIEERLTTGQFDVAATFQESAGGAGPASLISATGERLVLGDEPITVGRVTDCQLIIDDTNVSRRHAEIRPTPSGWTVTDLKSTNGTTVNGKPVSESVLAHGDVVSFGSFAVTFEAT